MLEQILKGVDTTLIGRAIFTLSTALVVSGCDGNTSVSTPSPIPTNNRPVATETVREPTPSQSTQTPNPIPEPTEQIYETPIAEPPPQLTLEAEVVNPTPTLVVPTPTIWVPTPTSIVVPTSTLVAPTPTIVVPTPTIEVPTPTIVPTATPLPTNTPTPLTDLQKPIVHANFLHANPDGTTSYRIVVTGKYVDPLPNRFNVEFNGLEGIIDKSHQVRNIKGGYYALVIPDVRLPSGAYNFTAEVNSDNSLVELRKDNNKSEAYNLEVYKPVRSTLEELDYFVRSVGSIPFKWQNQIPIHVEFYGSADKTVKPSEESIRNFMDDDMENATDGNLTFVYTKASAGDPILEVYLGVPHSELYTLFPDESPSKINEIGGAFEWLSITPDGYITKSRIAMAKKGHNRTEPFSKEYTNFLTKHEKINVLGAFIDQEDGPITSVLNDTPRNPNEYPQQYIPLDLKVLEILYSPLVKPGMSPNEIKDRLSIVNN